MRTLNRAVFTSAKTGGGSAVSDSITLAVSGGSSYVPAPTKPVSFALHTSDGLSLANVLAGVGAFSPQVSAGLSFPTNGAVSGAFTIAELSGVSFLGNRGIPVAFALHTSDGIAHSSILSGVGAFLPAVSMGLSFPNNISGHSSFSAAVSAGFSPIGNAEVFSAIHLDAGLHASISARNFLMAFALHTTQGLTLAMALGGVAVLGIGVTPDLVFSTNASVKSAFTLASGVAVIFPAPVFTGDLTLGLTGGLSLSAKLNAAGVFALHTSDGLAWTVSAGMKSAFALHESSGLQFTPSSGIAAAFHVDAGLHIALARTPVISKSLALHVTAGETLSYSLNAAGHVTLSLSKSLSFATKQAATGTLPLHAGLHVGLAGIGVVHLSMSIGALVASFGIAARNAELPEQFGPNPTAGESGIFRDPGTSGTPEQFKPSTGGAPEIFKP